MATYYWVGGNGTWDATTTTNWSSSSGGTGGAGFPTSVDDVIFDISSGTGTITCTGAVCNNLTVNPTQFMTLGTTSSTISIYGNLVFPATGSFTVSSLLSTTFAANTTGKTINIPSNINYNGAVTFNGVGGGWTLLSKLSISSSSLTLTNGSLNTNGFQLTFSQITYSATGIFSLTLGTSLIATTSWNFSNTTGLTFSGASSSFFYQNPGAAIFYGGGLTYGNFYYTTPPVGTASITFTGANTFTGSFYSQGSTGNRPTSLIFPSSVTTTIGFWGASGSSSYILTLQSSTAGTQATIAISGSVLSSITYASIKDIKVTSSATFNASNSTNVSNNTGITFGSPLTFYWVGGIGIWDNFTPTNWSSSSGGSGGYGVPSQGDNVIIDTSSGTGSITVNSGNCNNLTVTATQAIILGTISNSTVYICGSLSFPTSSSFTASTAANLYFIGGSGTQTINTNGINLNIISFYGTGNTWNLNSSLSCTSNFIFNGGTINTNNYNISAGQGFTVSMSFGCTGVFNLGTSTLTGINWLAAATSLTMNASNSTIIINGASNTFQGAGFTYGNLVFSPTTTNGTYSITGSNTFVGTISSTATIPFVINLQSSTTTTVGNWTASGTAGNLITLKSSIAGTQATLTKSGGGTVSASYLSIKDSKATPSSTWTAINSTNVSNNTGWTFTTVINNSGNFLLLF